MTANALVYAACFIFGCCAGNAVFDVRHRRFGDLVLDLAGMGLCLLAVAR